MIIHGLSGTRESYGQILRLLSKFNSQIYQCVDEKTQLDWVSPEMVTGFVVDPIYYNYEPLVSLLRSRNFEPKLFTPNLKHLTI